MTTGQAIVLATALSDSPRNKYNDNKVWASVKLQHAVKKKLIITNKTALYAGLGLSR